MDGRKGRKSDKPMDIQIDTDTQKRGQTRRQTVRQTDTQIDGKKDKKREEMTNEWKERIKSQRTERETVSRFLLETARRVKQKSLRNDGSKVPFPPSLLSLLRRSGWSGGK